MRSLPSDAEREGRAVYVIPEELLNAKPPEDISVSMLIATVWKQKFVVLAAALAFSVGSGAYALMATEWFRAEVLLAPVDERSKSAIGSQLGGLAALAGVNLGGSDSSEAIAILESRQFATRFIEDLGLMQIFFADEWDAGNGHWKGSDVEGWPDLRDGVRLFQEKLLRVTEDPRTGLVTLSVDWTDPDVAADWAHILVKRLNEKMRVRALQDAESNVNYLQSQLEKTSLVTLQQSIGQLLESELQKAMLARGNEEFAFRVIDFSGPPKERVRPRRTLLVVLGALAGGLLGVILVLVRAREIIGGRSTE